MSYRITTGPVAEPLSMSYVRNFLKLDTSEDDEFLLTLMASARLWAENITGRCLMPQTVTQYADTFPCGSVIELEKTPAASVTSVEYKNAAGVYTALANTNYTLDEIAEPPRLTLNYNASWPSIGTYVNAVKIVFVAGYSSASDIPAPIKQAMCLIIGHWYDNREDMVLGESSNPSIRSASWLLNQYRITII